MKIIVNGEEIEVGGGSDLTFGDGFTQEGDTVSITTPVRDLTEEEYEALPEEEKNKGLIFLPDDSEDTPSNGDSGSTSQEIYSTEETVIGRWIDGKPLYQKTLVEKNATIPKNSYVPLAINESCDIIMFKDGFIQIPTADLFFPINNYQNTSNYNSCHCASGTENSIRVSTASGMEKVTIVATVLYTKTTDQATIQLDIPQLPNPTEITEPDTTEELTEPDTTEEVTEYEEENDSEWTGD